MSTILAGEPISDERVSSFLRQNDAQTEFQTVCKLARQCFPELVSLQARLQEDVDEAGRLRVVLHVALPEAHPLDLLLGQTRQYHAQFVEQVPRSRCPLFALLTHFVAR
jgi:hypothetical protein